MVKKYRLIAWVIMPNHVHFLAKPLKKEHLPNILHTIKSYTAHEINKILNRKAQFRQHESFDRYIRNEEHFVNVVGYIENNPVKAGLCQAARDWRFGSAHFRSG
jgi:putative DNA methylase